MKKLKILIPVITILLSFSIANAQTDYTYGNKSDAREKNRRNDNRAAEKGYRNTTIDRNDENDSDDADYSDDYHRGQMVTSGGGNNPGVGDYNRKSEMEEAYRRSKAAEQRKNKDREKDDADYADNYYRGQMITNTSGGGNNPGVGDYNNRSEEAEAIRQSRTVERKKNKDREKDDADYGDNYRRGQMVTSPRGNTPGVGDYNNRNEKAEAERQSRTVERKKNKDREKDDADYDDNYHRGQMVTSPRGNTPGAGDYNQPRNDDKRLEERTYGTKRNDNSRINNKEKGNSQKNKRKGKKDKNNL